MSWKLDALEVSSAIAAIRGEGNLQDVESIVDGFERLGGALERAESIPYESARRPSEEILNLINGRITSIRFETNRFDAEVSSNVLKGKPTPPKFVVRLGAVRGRIQSLSNREGLRFTLYDDLEDRAVSCYLESGQEEAMREAWGRYAIVEGLVRRNIDTGKPSTVRRVKKVTVLPEGDSLDYRAAIGCAPAIPGSISAEEAIRRGRDG